jgi:hypothetical protein
MAETFLLPTLLLAEALELTLAPTTTTPEDGAGGDEAKRPSISSSTLETTRLVLAGMLSRLLQLFVLSSSDTRASGSKSKLG